MSDPTNEAPGAVGRDGGQKVIQSDSNSTPAMASPSSIRLGERFAFLRAMRRDIAAAEAAGNMALAVLLLQAKVDFAKAVRLQDREVRP